MYDNRVVDPKSGDRRVARSRAAIIGAFNQIMFEDGCASISATRIIERANIARSTFYAHFNNCDEILAESIGALFKRLAFASLDPEGEAKLAMLCQHFWAGRKLAQSILTGRRGTAMTRLLADQFATAIADSGNAANLKQSDSLIGPVAIWLASANIGLLLNWVTGRVSGDPDLMAKLISDTSQGAVRSLLEGLAR